MKKYFVILLILSLSAAHSRAQRPPEWEKIGIGQPLVEFYDEQVVVTFDISVAPKTVKNKHAYRLTPILNNGRYSLRLSPVVIGWVNDRALPGDSPNMLRMGNGETARYKTIVPLQEWMAGAGLSLEGVSSDRRRSTEPSSRVLVSPGRQPLQREPVPVPDAWSEPFALYKYLPPPPGPGPVSEGDQLAGDYPFVSPVPQTGEYAGPFELYADRRSHSLILYYHVGRHDVVPGYRNNEQLLEELTAMIARMTAAPDSRIERIDIGGFASPEGDPEANDRLAYARAMSIKEHILKTTELPYYRILLYNGSIDWGGLRAMVGQSDLAGKREVLAIIDDTEHPETRLARLKELNGGSTYKSLLLHYFPELRTGAVIRLYYKNEKPAHEKSSFYRP